MSGLFPRIKMYVTAEFTINIFNPILSWLPQQYKFKLGKHKIQFTPAINSTWHTQKKGAVSKVNKKCISHPTRALLKPHHSFVYALYYMIYKED
jgi:hypothetical protein